MHELTENARVSREMSETWHVCIFSTLYIVIFGKLLGTHSPSGVDWTAQSVVMNEIGQLSMLNKLVLQTAAIHNSCNAKVMGVWNCVQILELLTRCII